jgi:hypothetical protein
LTALSQRLIVAAQRGDPAAQKAIDDIRRRSANRQGR